MAGPALREATDDELQLADWLDSTGKKAEPLAAPGFFHNAADGLPESAGRGLLKVLRTGATLAPSVPEVFGTGLAPEARDWWYQHTVDPLTDVIDGMAPDASTTGTAGQLLNGLTEGLTTFAGGPVSGIATAETDTATDLTRKGVGAKTALAVGVTQGLATAVGVKLPVLGKTLTSKLLTGAAGNVAAMEGSRKVSQALLSDHPDIAQQYQGDGASVAVDALMGLAFGAGHHLATRDAVLTARNADHFANRTAPGEPTTGAAAVAHQQAMSDAARQLDAGQPVSVAERVNLDDFVLHSELTAAGPKPRDTLHAMPLEQRRALRYNAPELDSYAALVEQQYGLPNGIINALKNAGEKSNSGQVSPAGARGVMQFIPENLAKYGVTDATDPLQMIEAAGRYLRDTSKQYGGNIDAMIADYNGGPRQAKLVLEGKAPAAKETAAYLDRVRAYMGEDYSRVQAAIPDMTAPEFPAPERFGPLDLRGEIGWSQRGGELVRAAYDDRMMNDAERLGMVDAMPGDVIGRTKWIGHPAPDGTESQFWRNRPDERLSIAGANAAMDKFARGEALRPIEQRFIAHAESVARDYDRMVQDLIEADTPVLNQPGRELRKQLVSNYLTEAVNPIDPHATAAEKLAQIHALTAENRPTIDGFLSKLDSELGTQSKSSVKSDAMILAKAARPSILKDRPWHDVEHVRDTLRFKTVVNSVDDLPAIAKKIAEQGWEVVKVDTAKMLQPKEWGWRFVALDLRMPNGQIVEHYMPLREMEAVKKQNHVLFEKWRNVDTWTMTPEQNAEYFADLKKSRASYDAAFQAAMSRSGLDESAVRASLASFEASAAGTVLKSARTSPVSLMGGVADHGDPSSRAARNPSEPSTTVNTRPSETKTSSDMGISSTGSVPETPLAAIAKLPDDLPLLETFDGNGDPVYRTAAEAKADIEAELARAQTEATAFLAAANCAIRRGQ